MSLALALGASCGQRSDELPAPPLTQLHYPGLMAAVGRSGADPVLEVVSTNLDNLYADGTLLGVPSASTSSAVPFLGGVVVTSDATEVRVLQDATDVLQGADTPTLTQCGFGADPLLYLGTRDQLYRMDVTSGVPVCGPGCTTGLDGRFAGDAWPVAISCPVPAGNRPRRAWVGYLAGVNNNGYVGQISLDAAGNPLNDLVQVYVGKGFPQAFAYDPTWDRLYFVTREYQLTSALRWIEPGPGGCLPFLDAFGVQDEQNRGCHVEYTGFVLSSVLRGAEGADVKLSNELSACETPVDPGVQCRKAYVAVRVYNADLAAVNGTRPIDDIGGQLWVMEIPQSDAAATPRLLRRLDVGLGVIRLQVIPRGPGLPDLVAAAARVDDQLWIYDDATGLIAAGVGRDKNGFPLLGHDLLGLAAVRLPTGVVRVFVTAMSDHWVSAVDVDPADPAAAYVVHEGDEPADASKPILHIRGSLP
jgi:hypothetical protein